MGSASNTERAFASTIGPQDHALDVTLTAPSRGGEPASVTAEQADRYEIRVELGRGGMGRVVSVVDRHLGREIAMKELLAAAQGEALSVGSVSRFVREAQVTGQLEHPGIVPVHELGRRSDGTLYYTMKRIRGRSLAAALADANSLDRRLGLLTAFRHVCEAVAYAHSRGVVHRDLKPDNVMVGAFGETLVVDWGLAKVRGEREEPNTERVTPTASSGAETVDGHAIGTPSYMSPEQARGDLTAIDERSDVWGLGAILFELLTGRAPFVGQTAVAVLAQVLTDEVPRVRSLEPRAAPELAAIADRALSREPAKRYASAEEVVSEIAAYQDGRAVRAYEYSSLELLRRFVRRNRAATVAAVIVLLASVVAGALVLLSYESEQRARRVAEHRAEEAIEQREEAHRALGQVLLDRALRALRDGDPAAAAVFAAASLRSDGSDGSGDGDDASVHRVVVARSIYADAEDARTWESEEPVDGDGCRPADSMLRDGRLLFVCEDGVGARRTGDDAMVRVRVPGATIAAGVDEHRVLVASSDAAACGLYDLDTAARVASTPCWQFSAVAGDVALLGSHSGLYAIDTANGATLRQVQSDGSFRLPALSRDATRFAVTRYPRPGVDVAPLSGTEDPITLATGALASSLAFSPDGARVAVTSWDVGVRIYDERTGAFVQRVPTDGWAHDLRWVAPDRILLIEEDTVTIRRVTDGLALERLHAPTAPGYRMAFDGDRLALHELGASRFVRAFRHVRDARIEARDLGDPIGALAWDATSSRVLASTARAVFVLPLVDAQLGEPVLTVQLPDGAGAAQEIAVARDGAIAILTADREVFLAEPGRAVRSILPPAGPALVVFAGLAFDPTGRVIHAATAGSAEVRRFDRAIDGAIASIPAVQTSEVLGITITADGAHMATASYDGTVCLWELGESPRVTHTVRGHEPLASDASFSPDGRLVATGDGVGNLRIIDSTSGEVLRSARVNGDWLNRVTWSPDGTRLATASDDGTSLVVDAATLHPVRIVRNGGSTNRALLIDSAIVSFDGSYVRRTPASTGIEDADPDELLSRAERAAGVRLVDLDVVATDGE